MIELFKVVEHKFDFEIKDYLRLSGGSISSVFKIETNHGNYVLKVNNVDKFNMFVLEKTGLEALKSTQTLSTPNVIAVDGTKDYSYLLMEYIAPGKSHKRTFKDFGEKLAHLHFNTADSFGFHSDNWIGSLPQKNKIHKKWSHFYWNQRILPQYELALTQNLISEKEIPSKDDFIQVIDQEFGKHPPALIHGDLWNGNYLINKDGNVVLIDPAVAYGHPMMDIGMSKLFGGFSNEFYKAYRQHNQCIENWENQIELSQWFYLLVHLNLFGKSYLSSVKQITTKYFNG